MPLSDQRLRRESVYGLTQIEGAAVSGSTGGIGEGSRQAMFSDFVQPDLTAIASASDKLSRG